MRNYLIRSSLQLKVAATNLVYMLLVVLILISMLIPQYLEIWQTDELHYQVAAAKIFLMLLDRMVIVVGAILIIGFVHQVLLTHKFCGPMVNFSKTFQKVRNGDLTRSVKLRRRDFLKREAAEINQMVTALADHIGRIKTAHRALDGELAAAAANLQNPEKLARILATARGHADRCTRQLQTFTLPDPMETDGPAEPAQRSSAKSRRPVAAKPGTASSGTAAGDKSRAKST